MNLLKSLANKKLIGRLRQLVRKEQNATLSILSHLAEVERRKLYLEKAYSTLTDYCIHELGYGDSSASRCVRVARVIHQIPDVYDLLEQRRLSFSAVVQVYRVLTGQNKDHLLPRLEGKSRSEIERIMAEYEPPRKVVDHAKPTLVKKLIVVERAPAGASPKSAAGAHTLQLGEMPRHSDGANDPAVKMSTHEVEVVLEKMFEIRFAADEELMGLIQWMKCHLSHRYPIGASFLEFFKYAINYLKQREDLAIQDKPRKSATKTETRYIPKAIKQHVRKKYDGRCAFVGSNGKRCNSDYLLQFDHYPVPYARGGPSNLSNLRLLCAKHNKYAAEQIYGKAAVQKHYIKEAPGAYRTTTRRSHSPRHVVMLQ